MAERVNTELRGLRAKPELYDELVEQLARTETDVERLRRSHYRDGIDPAWRNIANALAGALRPYTLLSQRPSATMRELAARAVEDAVLDGDEAVR